MKFLITILLITLSMASFSQMPKPVSAIIKTPESTCAEAQTIIEKSIKQYCDGVIKLKVSLTGVTSITWYPDRTNIEEIKAAISNAGFDADNVVANPDFYKSLPLCCKKIKDGGGKQPKKKPTH